MSAERAWKYLVEKCNWDGHAASTVSKDVAAFAAEEVRRERERVSELFKQFKNDCNDGKWQPKKFEAAIWELSRDERE